MDEKQNTEQEEKTWTENIKLPKYDTTYNIEWQSKSYERFSLHPILTTSYC